MPEVAILVGAGALGATDEVLEVADLLGAGISKALLGKAVIPDEAPGCCGSIGLLGTKPSWDMMMGCDTLLMIGSSFPYSEFLPKEGQARGVQIEIDGKMPSIRYPMEVPLVGDSLETLRALIPLLIRKTDRSWRESIESNIADWWKVLEARAIAASSRELHPFFRQRKFGQLVCARPQSTTRHDGDVVGEPGDDGTRRPLCHRGQIRLAGACRHRLGWRRRDVDEWN
jgi:pyruvate dehydrogenase (quinone)